MEEFKEQISQFRKTHHYQTKIIDGATFNYLLCGKGKKTIMFLVGGMGVSELWMPYIKLLENDYQILTFDYPFELKNNISLAEGIFKLLKALDIPKVAIFGASYGGYLGQIFAAAYPEQTEALCLSSTAAFTKQTMDDLAAGFGKKIRPMLWMIRHLPYSLIKKVEKRSCMQNLDNATPEETEYMEGLFSEVYRTYTRKLDLYITELLVDLLNVKPYTAKDFTALDGRVLLFFPAHDATFTPEMQKNLIDLMPNPKVVGNMEGGHVATFLRCEEYTDIVREFLKEV